MNTHVAIPTTDVASSVAFYERLGFSVEQNYAKPGSDLHITRMKRDDTFFVELMSHPESAGISFTAVPELQHLGIAVDDLDHALAALGTLPVRMLKPITTGTAVKRYAFVADPSGFPVELYESND